MYLVNEQFLKEHNDFTAFEPIHFKSEGFTAQTVVENDFEGKNLNYKVKDDNSFFASVKKEYENFEVIYVRGH